ncbi:MAG TPA: TonB-dependent receptor, partial [Gammaproteobacteria bacterium]|nr:TonB-dependent receptor [Gammaproteobacteria bacterium]
MHSKGQGPTESVTSRAIELSGLAIAIAAVAAAGAVRPAAAQDAASLAASNDEITVVARRREESVQEVPIPVSVVGGDLVTDTGSFNVNRIKELVPTVQLYSSNPRNTGVNIRGLGAP